ncbi:hypothetical protein ES703_118861 [subsurface metagenome]
MAKFRTLDLHLTNLKVTRLGPGRYRNEVMCRDWDDGVGIPFDTITPYPILAISNFKVRVQVEDLIESPAEE